jgi:hypothetical protein
MKSKIISLAAVGVFLSSLLLMSSTSALTVPSKPVSASAIEAEHSVTGLDNCTQSSTCDTREANFKFTYYASVCSLADCNFISAADYERAVLYLDPTPSVLKSEYQAAGQTFNGGLNMAQLWSYWRSSGIDGAYATNIAQYPHSKSSVESAVSSNGALIIELVVRKNEVAGSLRWNGTGTILTIVDGFTPKGPLVVYRADEIQMTWAQWNAQVRGMWGITATTVPPSTATTTTTTTTTTPTTPITTTTTAPTGIPSSHYGPQGEAYQTYGNVYPADLGDCTFAGAANWEQLILKANPDPTVIGYQFAEAGGSATNGLSMSQLFNYWYEDGIAGYYLHGYNSYYTDQVDVENGVLDYGAMIVSLNFVAGDYIGNQQVNAGGHVVVVDGYTPEGPLVVTWGTTIQMSWQQWSVEVVGMYGINASSSPN